MPWRTLVNYGEKSFKTLAPGLRFAGRVAILYLGRAKPGNIDGKSGLAFTKPLAVIWIIYIVERYAITPATATVITYLPWPPWVTQHR